jgi:hypothetical protein
VKKQRNGCTAECFTERDSKLNVDTLYLLHFVKETALVCATMINVKCG